MTQPKERGTAVAVAEYGRYDALGLAELVRTGQVSATELLDEALDRVARVNPQLNAVIHLMESRARDSIAAGLPGGPLAGVPFLLKDLMTAYAGEPMRCGSRLFRDYVPQADEELTRRYRAAGLVIFGKTNTPELGVSNVTEPELCGPTRNPWNLERTSSGSSGGSAAAVAARIVPAANANDGGGSIRTPASNCGLVGLKPSRGRNPTGPAAPDVWWGFIGEHAVTRTVRDCAALLDATCGDYPQQLMKLAPPPNSYLDEIRRPPQALRVGVSFDPGLGKT
ncbi:MAG: amidase, partial [Steroidobacteraceae bacterium]